MIGESYNEHIKRIAGLFEKGRRYALGTYFGLSPGGELIFGVEQGGEILPNLVHPCDEVQINYLLNLDSMSIGEAVPTQDVKTPKHIFQEALETLSALSLEEQNGFVRDVKSAIERNREEMLARFKKEIEELQQRCEEIERFQRELSGI